MSRWKRSEARMRRDVVQQGVRGGRKSRHVLGVLKLLDPQLLREYKAEKRKKR